MTEQAALLQLAKEISELKGAMGSEFHTIRTALADLKELPVKVEGLRRDQVALEERVAARLSIQDERIDDLEERETARIKFLRPDNLWAWMFALVASLSALFAAVYYLVHFGN